LEALLFTCAILNDPCLHVTTQHLFNTFLVRRAGMELSVELLKPA
jgi:hypothetical protein